MKNYHKVSLINFWQNFLLYFKTNENPKTNFRIFSTEMNLDLTVKMWEMKFDFILFANFWGFKMRSHEPSLISQLHVWMYSTNLKRISWLFSSHYSKSQILVQKFNFDKTPTFSRVFNSKFFWQFFSWNQSCQQLKRPNPQHFHEFFTK